MDSRSMREFSGWSITLGRYGGIALQVHVFFPLFAVFSFYLAIRESANRQDNGLVWLTVEAVSVLFVSVLLHEVGHVIASLRVGGRVTEVVLWPVGGLVEAPAPHDPEAERIVALAGPTMNVLVLLFCLPVLWMIGQERIGGLMNPLRPQLSFLRPDAAAWITAVEIIFWINWLLFLVNLLPAFPFDGGRVLRSILWPACSGVRTATYWTARAAQLAAVVLVAIAWFTSGPTSDLAPAWVPLVLLAIILFFSGKKEIERLQEEESEPIPLASEYLPDYLFEAPPPRPNRRENFVARWIRRRREVHLQRLHEIEVDEERRADEILARVHTLGLESLTLQERSLLERVSARYRERQRHES